MNPEKAVSWINEYGFLLVYPQKTAPVKKAKAKKGDGKKPINKPINKEKVISLWDLYFPNTKMNWSWDSDADNRVSRLWILREGLCHDKRIVYSKAFQNRAAFFSKKMFCSLLSVKLAKRNPLSPAARLILEALEMDSPLSTKQVKLATDLRGKLFEAEFVRATKQLWQNGLIIGMGEIDDGAFPSLAYGATKTVHEDLYASAEQGPQPKLFESLPEIVKKALRDRPSLEGENHEL